ncbi:ATP-binding cassette domain-containing protein [Thermococcus sp. Bubb.Bath]|uniref:ATP-binding cassette domain-containing protein n=1 Tax=Thermococcus sp. Bubb.Bath TaxID=1638242 RepID=UPI001439D83B|nr:ATP-binding cassette domain-containing protein [Thermococcus sp. Bubb.Bath]
MIVAENLKVIYKTNGHVFIGLDGFSGEFEEGKISVVFGPSGSGKTSLLLSIGTMLRPTEGKVKYGNTDVYSLTEGEIRKLRRGIGISFQQPMFVNVLSVWENIELGLYGAGKLNDEYRRRARALAEELGISKILDKRSDEISGGEARRVAIVRSLAHDPNTILLDEPTAYLDEESSEKVVEVIRGEKEREKTIVVTTHDPSLIRIADVKFSLRYGKLVDSLV